MLPPRVPSIVIFPSAYTKACRKLLVSTIEPTTTPELLIAAA